MTRLPQEEAVTPCPTCIGKDVTDDLTFAMSHLTTEAARDLAWRKAYL